MNSSVLTASLTGRIQFFCDVATNHYFSFCCDCDIERLASIPPWPCCGLEAELHRSAAALRGVNEGTSPLARSRHCGTATAVRHCSMM